MPAALAPARAPGNGCCFALRLKRRTNIIPHPVLYEFRLHFFLRTSGFCVFHSHVAVNIFIACALGSALEETKVVSP